MKKRNKTEPIRTTEENPVSVTVDEKTEQALPEESTCASADEVTDTVSSVPETEDASVQPTEPDVPDTENAGEAEEKTSDSAPSAVSEKPKKDASAVRAILKITLPLTIICIAVSLMLAVVNILTTDLIAANASREKEKAVRSIFADAEKIILHSWEDETEVFLVTDANELLGFCVSLSENGFGGAISMIVGMDTEGSVCGVRIVSMSETPGFGTRAKNDSFLATFTGAQPFVIGENFDALSGATITSRAVVAGVNHALSVVPDAASVASSHNLTVRPADSAQQDADTDISDAETDPAGDENKETSEPNTDNALEAPSSAVNPPDLGDDHVVAVVNLASRLPSAVIPARSSSVNRVLVTAVETEWVEETTEPVTDEAVFVETVPAETTPAEPTPEETVPAETTPEEAAQETPALSGI